MTDKLQQKLYEMEQRNSSPSLMGRVWVKRMVDYLLMKNKIRSREVENVPQYKFAYTRPLIDKKILGVELGFYQGIERIPGKRNDVVKVKDAYGITKNISIEDAVKEIKDPILGLTRTFSEHKIFECEGNFELHEINFFYGLGICRGNYEVRTLKVK